MLAEFAYVFRGNVSPTIGGVRRGSLRDAAGAREWVFKRERRFLTR